MATKEVQTVWKADNGRTYTTELGAVQMDAEYWKERCIAAEKRLEGLRDRHLADDASCSGPGGGQSRNHP